MPKRIPVEWTVEEDPHGLDIEDARKVARLVRRIVGALATDRSEGLVLQAVVPMLQRQWPELEWEIRGREILPFARDGATTSDVDTSTTSPFPSVAHEAISHTGRGATGDAALDDLAGQQSAGTALVLPAGDEQWRHDVEGWWHRPLKIQGNAIRIWLPVPDENVPDDVYDAETEYLALIGVDRINAE